MANKGISLTIIGITLILAVNATANWSGSQIIVSRRLAESTLRVMRVISSISPYMLSIGTVLGIIGGILLSGDKRKIQGKIQGDTQGDGLSS